MIDEMFVDFLLVSVLWDAAFSAASKIKPDVDEIYKFKRYVRVAIFSHQVLTISMTHKDHLMWEHMATVMVLPGGLEKKGRLD